MAEIGFASRADRTRPRLSVALTAISLVLFAAYLVAGALDPRLLEGAGVWAKPAKFALSFAVLFATLAWLETRLSPAWRDGRLLRLTLIVMTVSFAAEMGYMSVQAAQAEASHFNLSTPYHAFMYLAVMATGAVLLVAGIAVYGVAAARDHAAALDPGLRLGVSAGFVLSAVLTLIVASYMSQGTGHFVGVQTDPDRVLPLLGWSTETGDLRPAHFLALHAMQVLPVAGLLADRRAARNARLLVWLAAVGYAALTFGVFAQALAGRPLIPI